MTRPTILPPFPPDQTVTVRYAPLTEAPGRPVRIDYGTIAHEYVTRTDAIQIRDRSYLTTRCREATGMDPEWPQVREAYSQLAAVLGALDDQRHTVEAKPSDFAVRHDEDGGFTVVKEPVTEADFDLFPRTVKPKPEGYDRQARDEELAAMAAEDAELRAFGGGAKVSDEGEHRRPGEIRDLAMDLRAPGIEEDQILGYFAEDAEKGEMVTVVIPGEPFPDPVHAPSHYTDGGIETIDYLRAKLTTEAFVGFCQGNAMKYLSRAGKKGSAAEDFAKAEVYCRWARESMEGRT